MKTIKNKLFVISFIFLGISLFLFFLYKFGTESLEIIKLNINFYYLFAFFFMTFFSFVPFTMRLKVILDSFGKKVSLPRLIKQAIAGFSISYITPASRLGGEPVRIYMLKKESDIDYETSTSAIILDKFVEILGSALYGVIGLFLLISLPGVPMYFKIIFGLIVAFVLILLFFIYYKSHNNGNTFSALITFFRLHKFVKFKNSVKEIDLKIEDFFKNKKKVLLKSFMYYIITGIVFIIQFKLLLLSIGIDAPIGQLILIINIWGLINFIPVPGGLGFLESSQSGLFHLIQGSGAEGLAMALLLRVGYLLVVVVGLFLLSKFSIKQFFKKKKLNNKPADANSQV